MQRFFLFTEKVGPEIHSIINTVSHDLPEAGAYVSFEGRVRNHHKGRGVTRLIYSAYEAMALTAGEEIINEALTKFDILEARCIHWLGDLAIGDRAIWIGVWSAHREEAFEANRSILDTIKAQVPIWKKEFYQGGDYEWVANAVL